MSLSSGLIHESRRRLSCQLGSTNVEYLKCGLQRQMGYCVRSMFRLAVPSIKKRSYHSEPVSIYKFRDWVESGETRSEYQGTRSKFKVSTYNILNQHYVWPSVYKYVPEEYKDWNYRLKLLDSNFAELDADIMCFQEMENDVYESHWKKSPVFEGYDSVFMIKDPPKYWDKAPELMDGVGLFVRRSKFKIINTVSFKYADFALQHPELYHHTDSFTERLIPRNTVGIVATLEHVETKETVFVATTHLYWSPKFLDINLYHSLILTNVIKQEIKRAHKLNDSQLDNLLQKRMVPIVISGDFNSKNDSITHQFYSDGHIDLAKIDSFPEVDYGFEKKIIRSNLLPLTSAYRKLYEQGLFPTSTYTDKKVQIIDYIWYNSHRMNLVRNLGQIRAEYIASHTPMPNKDFPSDHIPLISEFELIV